MMATARQASRGWVPENDDAMTGASAGRRRGIVGRGIREGALLTRCGPLHPVTLEIEESERSDRVAFNHVAQAHVAHGDEQIESSCCRRSLIYNVGALRTRA